MLKCQVYFCKCFFILMFHYIVKTGYQCPDPTQPPEQCPAGYFSSAKGQTSCTQVNNIVNTLVSV